MTRNQKLAEIEAIAAGHRHGRDAFQDRLEEMGPGIGPRGNGRASKGGVSRPVEAAVGLTDRRPADVVSSARYDRLIDAAHALMLDLDAAYGEVARTQRGVPAKGKPSCGWCAEAVAAAEKVARRELAKARAKGNETVTLDDLAPIRLDYRSDTYLFAEERKGDKVVGKVLVCEWCYRFSIREERKPTIEERWVHAQGGRMPKKPKAPHQKSAERARAS